MPGLIRKKAMLQGILVGAMGVSACPGLIAEERVKDINLDPVVVTASRTERLQSEAPVRTEVISRTEIDKTHARSLKEALANVPGLQLRPVHGKSGYEAVMQGMTSDQLLVLINGMPMAASTGSTADLSQLALVDVERIEVVKGAASAQYGSSAMSGVINVITRQPQNGLRGSLTYDLGSYGSQNTSGKSSDIAQNHMNAAVEGGHGEWSGRLSGDVLDSKGFDADADNWTRPGDEINRKQAEGQLRWQSADGNYIDGTVQHYTEEDKQWLARETLGSTVLYPNKYEDISRNRLTLSSGWQLGSARLSGKLLAEDYASDSVKQNIRDGLRLDLYDDRDMELNTRFLSLQLDLPAARHALQFGFDARYEELKQFKDGVSELNPDVIDGDGFVSRRNYEIFLQDDYFFNASGELVFGLRVQHDSDFGGYASPKISLRYDVFSNANYEAVVRTSIGTGYRVPNLKERYFTFDHSSMYYLVMGNEELDPESSRSVQAGVDLSSAGGSSVSINVFYNDIDDLIQTDEDNYATDAEGNSVYTYKNIDNAFTYGVETAISQPLFNSIKLNLAHTYTYAEDKDTGNRLTRRPEHIARLGIDWQATAALGFSARVRYQSKELSDTEDNTWSPAWTTLDLKLNYHATQSADVFAGVDNVTSRQRDFEREGDFGPVSGRFIYLGTTWKY